MSHFSRRKNKITISGSCKLCGLCCKGIHIFDCNDWLKSEKRLKELQKKDSRYNRLVIIDKIQKGYLTLSCTALGNDGKCTDYDNRFEFCKSYPTEKIFSKGAKLGNECGYCVNYTVPFEKFLQKQMKQK